MEKNKAFMKIRFMAYPKMEQVIYGLLQRMDYSVCW